MNKVFVNQDTIVEIIVDGDQTVDSVKIMANDARRLLEQSAGRRLVLDNLLDIGIVPPEGRKQVVEEAKSLHYDRLAMLGKGTGMKLAANLLLRAIGKGSKVRYFDDREAAIEWLKGR